MSDIRIEPEWLVTGAALLLIGTGGYLAYGAFQRRSRRKGLLARLERIAYQAAHQVLVPDGMAASFTSTTSCSPAAGCSCSIRGASPASSSAAIR